MDFVKFYIRKLTKAHGPIAQWNVFTIVTLRFQVRITDEKRFKNRERKFTYETWNQDDACREIF